MKRSFCAEPVRFGICIVTVLMALTLGCVLLYIDRLGSALVFFAIGALFCIVAIPYGSVITVDEEGITKKFLGITLAELSWEEISEVGVTGTRVFNGNDKKKTGTLCIYFSQKTMTEDERFQMMLRWPVKDIPFMVYNSERLLAVQMCWSSDIVYYNAGDAKYFMTKQGLK